MSLCADQAHPSYYVILTMEAKVVLLPCLKKPIVSIVDHINPLKLSTKMLQRGHRCSSKIILLIIIKTKKKKEMNVLIAIF